MHSFVSPGAQSRLRRPAGQAVGGALASAADRLLSSVTALGAIALVALGVAAGAGIHPRIEQSGSMSPVLRPGDLLFIKTIHPASARKGEIVTFRDPGRDTELTHRVVSVHRQGPSIAFVTRGDANAAAERWSVPASGTIGREVYALTGVGAAIDALRGAPLVIAAWLAAPFLLLALLRRIWGRP